MPDIKPRWIILMLVAVALAGCSKSRTSQSQEMQVAVDRAQRRYDKALSLFAMPVKSEAPAGVNPEVLKVLDAAQADLAAAMEKNPDADSSLKAQGRRVLGLMAMLRGQYYRKLGDKDVVRTVALLDETRGVVAGMQAQLSLARYFEASLKMSTDELQKALSEETAAADKLEKEAQAVQKQIAALKKTIDQQMQEASKLGNQASKLRTESALTGGEEGLELSRQAAMTEAKRSELIAKIAKMEHQTDSLIAQAEMLQIRLVGAKGRANSIQAILKGRKNVRDVQEATRKDIIKGLDSANAKLRELADKVAGSYEKAAVLTGQAGEAYDVAVQHLKSAANISRADAPTLSLYAKALMDRASVTMELNPARSQCGMMADELARVGESTQASMESAIDKLRACASRKKADEQAVADMTAAIDIYTKAVKAASPVTRWVYQGQLAGAYYARYLQTQNAADKKEALRLVDEALEGRENSQHLASICLLRETIIVP